MMHASVHSTGPDHTSGDDPHWPQGGYCIGEQYSGHRTRRGMATGKAGGLGSAKVRFTSNEVWPLTVEDRLDHHVHEDRFNAEGDGHAHCVWSKVGEEGSTHDRECMPRQRELGCLARGVEDAVSNRVAPKGLEHAVDGVVEDVGVGKRDRHRESLWLDPAGRLQRQHAPLGRGRTLPSGVVRT